MNKSDKILEVELEATNNTELASQILKYGEAAKVINPINLASMKKEKWKQMTESY